MKGRDTPHRLWGLSCLVAVVCGCGPGAFGDGSQDSGSDDPTTATTPDPTVEPSDTSDTSDTDTSTSSSSTDDGFVPPDQDILSSDPCDPFMQDCADGEKCVPYASTGGSWDTNRCVPVLGDQAVDEACVFHGFDEGTDNCDADGYCWDTIDMDGELVGRCHAFCRGAADDPMCPPGSQCLISSEGSISICLKTCDPLLQDCDEGLACYWANNGFNCIFTTENTQAGLPCAFINDCDAGLGCLPAEVMPNCEGSACCSPFCDITDGSETCAVIEGTECAAFFEVGMAPPGYEHVGVCISP